MSCKKPYSEMKPIHENTLRLTDVGGMRVATVQTSRGACVYIVRLSDWAFLAEDYFPNDKQALEAHQRTVEKIVAITTNN